MLTKMEISGMIEGMEELRMDKKKLIQLFQDGMAYPPGKHHFWISRCFEITVRQNEGVELNEYESFAAQKRTSAPFRRVSDKEGQGQMFHVGRTLLLKDGRVIEEGGAGGGAV